MQEKREKFLIYGKKEGTHNLCFKRNFKMKKERNNHNNKHNNHAFLFKIYKKKFSKKKINV